MDPTVAIDPYLHDLIFQHFTGTELTEIVSFVSPEWSRIVGSSRVCMNKVKFSFQVWRHKLHSFSEVFKCAQKTWRDYQHVIIECQNNDDSKEFWTFIERCCSSLVTLKVENVSRSAGGAQFTAMFPLLKVFDAIAVKDLVITSILSSTTKLEKLSILTTTSMMDPFMVEFLGKVMQRNPRLKDVYLKNVQRTLIDPNERVTECSFVDIFKEPLEANVQLKSLKLLDTTSRPITKDVEDNILAFLVSQKDSLETFSFNLESDKILELVFNNLPVLTSVGFTSNRFVTGLKRNINITNLEIPYIDETSTIKDFINKTPNLKKLFAGTVTKELIEYLAQNFMNLRSLNFKMIDLDGEEFYEQFKSENPDANQEIVIWDYEIDDWD